MFTYDEASEASLNDLLSSDAAIVERARRLLGIDKTIAGVVRYGAQSIAAMIYFYDDRATFDAAVSDPSSNDWSTASLTVRMDRAGACFAE